MDANHWFQQQKQKQQQQQNLVQQSIQRQQNLVQHSIQQQQQNPVQKSIQQRQQQQQNLVQQSIQKRQQKNLVQHTIQQQKQILVQHTIQQQQPRKQQQNQVQQSIQQQQPRQQQNLVQQSIQQQQQNLVQQSIQQQQPRQHQNLVQQPETFKNLYNTDGMIDLADLPQYPPYIDHFHVVGLTPAPYPAPVADGTDAVPWNNGSEPRKKRLQEQDFLENNSQIIPVDFFQTRPVSTGLGLSMDNGCLASSFDSSFLGILVNDIEIQLSKYKDELDQYITVQAEQLKREILEKMEAYKMRAISYLEQKVIEKIRAQENEVEDINKRNVKLLHQIEQLSMESHMWRQRSNNDENLIKELRFTLEQLNAQTGDRNEGYGDNEVVDTVSCVKGQRRTTTPPFTCIVCEAKGACMILMPCKHLCVCKDCESGIRVCPICQTPKNSYIEVIL